MAEYKTKSIKADKLKQDCEKSSNRYLLTYLLKVWLKLERFIFLCTKISDLNCV